MNKILFVIFIMWLFHKRATSVPIMDIIEGVTSQARGMLGSAMNMNMDLSTLKRFNKFLNLPPEEQLTSNGSANGELAIIHYFSQLNEYTERVHTMSPSEEVRLTMLIIYKITVRQDIYSAVWSYWEQIQPSLNNYYIVNSRTIQELAKEVDVSGSIDDIDTMLAQIAVVEKVIGLPTDNNPVTTTKRDHARALFNMAIASRQAQRTQNVQLKASDRLYAIVDQTLHSKSDETRQGNRGSGSEYTSRAVMGAATAFLRPNTDAVIQSRNLPVTTPSSFPVDIINVIQRSICISTTQLLRLTHLNADKINVGFNSQIRIIYERILYVAYYYCAQPELNQLMPNFADAATQFCAVFKDMQLSHQCNEPWRTHHSQPTTHYDQRLHHSVLEASAHRTAGTPAYRDASISAQFHQVPAQTDTLQSSALGMQPLSSGGDASTTFTTPISEDIYPMRTSATSTPLAHSRSTQPKNSATPLPFPDVSSD